MHPNTVLPSFALIFLIELFYLKVTVEGSDPHESISKRTPMGVPYYFQKSLMFPKSFFTTTGLLVLEFGAKKNSSNFVQPRMENDSEETLFQNTEIFETCEPGDIFRDLIFTNEDKQKFYKQLKTSCFTDKLQINHDNQFINDDDFDISLMERVLDDCKSRRIPESLIAPPHLHLLLSQFLKKLEMTSEFQLSLPLANLSFYYKLKIASCAFTGDSVMVSIQIPLLNANCQLQSYKLTPIPLWMPSDQNTVCYLIDRANPSFPEGTYYVLSSPDIIVPYKEKVCGIGHQDICYIPNHKDHIMKRSMRRSCVQAIMESQDEDMACTLKCEPSGTFNYPIIRKVASDRYLIVGDLRVQQDQESQNLNTSVLRVECPPFQKEEILTFPPTGALEIILPCDCHIRYRQQIFKAESEACGAEFSKVPINFPGEFDIRDAAD